MCKNAKLVKKNLTKRQHKFLSVVEGCQRKQINDNYWDNLLLTTETKNTKYKRPLSRF